MSLVETSVNEPKHQTRKATRGETAAVPGKKIEEITVHVISETTMVIDHGMIDGAQTTDHVTTDGGLTIDHVIMTGI